MGNLHLEGLALVLPGLALRWVLNKRFNPKGNGKKHVAIAVVAVCLIVGLGIAYSFVGDWLAAAIRGLAGTSSALTVGVPLACVIATAGVVIGDVMYDRTADKGAQFAAMLAPTMLVLVIAGTVGASGGNAVRGSYDTIHATVVKMSGTAHQTAVHGHKK